LHKKAVGSLVTGGKLRRGKNSVRRSSHQEGEEAVPVSELRKWNEKSSEGLESSWKGEGLPVPDLGCNGEEEGKRRDGGRL